MGEHVRTGRTRHLDVSQYVEVSSGDHERICARVSQQVSGTEDAVKGLSSAVVRLHLFFGRTNENFHATRDQWATIKQLADRAFAEYDTTFAGGDPSAPRSEGSVTFSEPVRLPDGSGFMTASFPLPKDHWLYADHENEPPAPMRVGLSTARSALADQIKAAARYAIRASTMNGKESDFDPDAMVQNMIVGLLGYSRVSNL